MFNGVTFASNRARGRYVRAMPRIVEMMSHTGSRTPIVRTLRTSRRSRKSNSLAFTAVTFSWRTNSRKISAEIPRKAATGKNVIRTASTWENPKVGDCSTLMRTPARTAPMM
jgi:hypothetical protein